MKVELLYNTPLWVCVKAIRKCWASEDKSDSRMPEIDSYLCDGNIICGEKDKALIERVGNKNKHSSTLEHLNYTFDIDGISRALLQELSRHRHASLSVKSTRYTLKELKNDGVVWFNDAGETTDEGYGLVEKYCVLPKNLSFPEEVKIKLTLSCSLGYIAHSKLNNDKAKYALPEAFKTSLVYTINARSLQNLLQLRTSKSALWEFQELAKELYNNLPEDHKYLFKEFIND